MKEQDPSSLERKSFKKWEQQMKLIETIKRKKEAQAKHRSNISGLLVYFSVLLASQLYNTPTNLCRPSSGPPPYASEILTLEVKLSYR